MAETNESEQRIAFVGLGSMGGPMASRLVEAGLAVTGYDVRDEPMARLRQAGGRSAGSPAQAAADAGLLIVMVMDAQQVEDVLFGVSGAVAALPRKATVMLCSTVSPAFAQDLGQRLRDKGVDLLDAPVSGGVVGAEGGTLTVMASGSAAAFAACERALDAVSGRVYRLGDAPGMGSTVKMLNQLLAGVNMAAAAEAMAFGARAGIDPRLLFDVISNSTGSSWMFGSHVPHMLEGDFTPRGALDIFVKDLGIALDFARGVRFPLPITASAHQLFLMGSAAGLGSEDDSAVVKVYEKIAGVQVVPPKAPDSGERQ